MKLFEGPVDCARGRKKKKRFEGRGEERREEERLHHPLMNTPYMQAPILNTPKHSPWTH
jgi:hypothetical protein